MIRTSLLTIFYSFGLIAFLFGLQSLLFYPLTIIYEIWKKRALKKMAAFRGKVSVLIPAYNEEKTIRQCVESVLASRYRSIEVIVINDGSTDSTEEKIRDFIDNGRIRYISKQNGGKASALNTGLAAAGGELVIFTDADSFFLPDTVRQMARWFGNQSIDAVCGNDAPLNPESPVQKFLTVTTHIGTGFVRRALSAIGCLPIITGNLGAVRTSVLKEAGGFREIWGEDLELTFRLHRNGKKIVFDPEPKVIAECPRTLRSLWKQRVRWMRSYLKISSLYRDMFFRKKYAPFSYYLPVNFFNMAIIPLLQVALIAIIPVAYIAGGVSFTGVLEVLAYFGLLFFIIVAVYSIALDRDFKDLLYLPYGFLILPISYFYNAVVIFSWTREMLRSEERWEKIERRNMMQPGYRETAKWKTVCGALVLIIASSALTQVYIARSGQDAILMNKEDLIVATARGIKTENTRPAFHLGMSTHFDAWDDWQDALNSILNRPMIGGTEVVGIGAGRPEWVYFQWIGEEGSWANHQKAEKDDLLLKATNILHNKGMKAAAIIDLFAPKYIEQHPASAAVGFDGKKSDLQVGLMELVEGEYGRIVLDMIGVISKNYPVDIINLTEVSYYVYSFNEQDRRSFKAYTGLDKWPMDDRGMIDTEAPVIWEWKNAMMERFIKKAADITHKEGKELYVDVPVSWKDFSRNGKDSGLDYKMVLDYADKIIVWNYFYMEDASPAISRDLARHLVENFPISSFYLSIGLWGNDTPVDPASFADAVYNSLEGGAIQLWITPNHLITKMHWDNLLPYWNGQKP